MGDFTLRYAGYHVEPEDLKVNDCTIRTTTGENGAAYPRLWFYVLSDEGVALEMLGVPLAPNSTYSEGGPGGKTWGFTKTAAGVWQVAPSINVLQHPIHGVIIHPGEHPEIKTSSWHHTPVVVGVPEGEPWQ
jgi:hypothetical protein